jgi:hypothetical protein
VRGDRTGDDDLRKSALKVLEEFVLLRPHVAA